MGRKIDLRVMSPTPDRAGTPLLTDRFIDALVFAAGLHLAQSRKGSGIPYAGHLLGVCALVLEERGTEDEAIAALLHDAVEDQGGEEILAEIRGRFGDAVADIVLACSDTLVEPKPPWRERKQAYLTHLDGQPQSVLLVSLADKLFNARAIRRDYLLVGDAVWNRFNAGRDGQLWYYRSLSDAFGRLLPSIPMTNELADAVDELEHLVAADSPPRPARAMKRED